MINEKALQRVEEEMARLNRAIKEYREKDKHGIYNCQESGSVKRCSIELSRAMVKLRKGKFQ